MSFLIKYINKWQLKMIDILTYVEQGQEVEPFPNKWQNPQASNNLITRSTKNLWVGYCLSNCVYIGKMQQQNCDLWIWMLIAK